MVWILNQQSKRSGSASLDRWLSPHWTGGSAAKEYSYMEEPKILCIKDTGIGIAPEDLPRIFEKGYTGYNGRADKKASGIGLYLCKRICTNLGHQISAVSEPDQGTLIRISLKQERLKVE